MTIKVAPARNLAPEARARREYEIAVLTQEGLSPSAAAVHQAAEGDLVYSVRPYLPGITLADALQKQALSAPDTARIGISALATLVRTHRHGVLHRGIKPSNLVLADARPDRAHLVDFAPARHPYSGDDVPISIDSAQYLSPEQCGLINVAIDDRSDLNSLGIVLYEALVGQPPFSGKDATEILRKRLTARPPPLATVVAGVPRGLESIIERLLRKDPRDRYQTAAGALADLERLAAALEGGGDAPEVVIGAHDRRSVVTEPTFIGRSQEISALEEDLARAREGAGGLVLVEGQSGQGKTWVLSELGRRAESLGTRVLRGQGLDRVAQRPYYVLSEVIRELVSRMRFDRAWGESIRERLGPSSAAACDSLPELRAIVPEAKYSSLGPEAHGEARSIAALGALVDSLGDRGEPAVILLDDAQWIEESTLRLLDQWQREGPPHGGRHVLVVMAFRPEEVGADHPLQSVGPLHRLRLPAFGAEEVRAQVASMAGQLPERAIREVQSHADGNPFLASATLHGMVEVGALYSTASGWRVNASNLAMLQTAEHAAQILELRLAKLVEPTRRLLAVAALLGRTFDPALAAALAGVETREAMQIAEERRGSLVWADESGTRFTFVHDKIREALLEDLSEDERRDLHRRTADYIEARDRSRAFELAYHLDAAGAPGRALPFALEAAESARARFATELAEFYYRIAERGAAEAGAEERFATLRGLGDVLTLRNRYDDAVDHYMGALEFAATRRQKADVERSWSQLEMKRGNMLAACEHAENALRLVGHRVPPNEAVLMLWNLWEALVQVLHTYLPDRFVRERRGRNDEDELFAIGIYHALNGPYFFSRNEKWAAWAHLRLINLAERHPGSRALGRAYAAHATGLLTFPSLFARGVRISKAGADLCEQLGDLWGQAQGLTFHATMLYLTGRFDEAIETGRKGSELFDRTGDRWEATHGLDFAVDALVRKGDLAGAVRQAREIWQRGIEIGDSHALAWSLDAWSRATDGAISEEMVDIARSRARDLQTSLAVAQADGVRLIAEGKLDEAVAVLEEARSRTMKQAYFYELNIHILTYLVTALRMQAERTSPRNPGKRRRWLDRAATVAKQALAVTRKHRLSLPHALRECAIVAAMQDKARLARERIDESVTVAEELGERYELAQSRLARAELGRELGWEIGDEELAAARREVAAIRGSARSVREPPERSEADRVTLSLVDRFATVLETGRAIATALSPEAIYSETRRAALLLLRGEHCVVLERSDAPPPDVVSVHGDIGLSCSPDVIGHATEQGRSVALSAAEALEDVTSRRSAARSVLCVPIRVRGEIRAYLYLTHGEVSDLFGADEQRIGDFLGTLAGAALENAEGFAKLQSFSRELEARVEERTHQLAQTNRDLEESLRQVQQTQEQLVQASKMAALGTLVAGLSHELNNPLSVVLGYVEVLSRQTPEDHPSRAALVAIERQAKRCSSLVRALLDFSRREPTARAPTSPASIFDTALELVASTAREREVEISSELPADPIPDILVSAREIESALLNVLSNAIDAASPGGSVTLEARSQPRDEVPGVLFSVTDTGPGIPSDVLSHVFDPFFTTKPTGQGTGLGLSITHQIVTAHDGAVDVDTTEGEGTTIGIWLPVAANPARADPGERRLQDAVSRRQT